MTVPEPRLPDYLDHILEAIRRIRTYTEDIVEVAFLEDTLVQDGVIRNIEVIGEAAKNVEQRYPEFSAKHPEVPWGWSTQCATAWRMDTSRLIWKLCGARFRMICLSLSSALSSYELTCPNNHGSP